MTNTLKDILRQTLTVIERSEEFRQDAPAIIQLRRDMARAIGDLEVLKANRSLDKTAEPAQEALRESGRVNTESEQERQNVNKKEPKSFPLRLPQTTRLKAGELARQEGISLNQFIAQAVAEAITRFDCRPLTKPNSQ